MVSTSRLSVIVGSLYRDYQQKTVATNSFTILGWHTLVKKFLSTEDRTNVASYSMSSKQYALNLAAVGLGQIRDLVCNRQYYMAICYFTSYSDETIINVLL